MPSWSAQLGSARTSAYGDVVARLGYHLAHPWSPAARARAGARDFGIWLYAGVRESLVAYDQLLDRSYAKNDSTFSVNRIPWVNSYQFGIAIGAIHSRSPSAALTTERSTERRRCRITRTARSP